MRSVFLACVCVGVAAAQSSVTMPAGTELEKMRADLQRSERVLLDWPNLTRYHADNTQLSAPAAGEARVVFMGDSITDAWGRKYGKMLASKPYVNRGISGQTTPQMLIRFRPDVVALRPKVVVLLAGTNDIAGNTGPMTLEAIEDNIASMVDIAKANNIRVVLSSVLPVTDAIRPQTVRRPPEKITALNTWMKDYAARQGLVYLDYYSAMLDEQQRFKQELTYDGLHPNDAGYAIMEPLAIKAVETALKQP